MVCGQLREAILEGCVGLRVAELAFLVLLDERFRWGAQCQCGRLRGLGHHTSADEQREGEGDDKGEFPHVVIITC